MSVSYKDYYKVLEVERTATKEEIDKAYKRLARKHHPDLNQGNAESEERFKDINEAHEVLKDPEKRRMYDQLGPNWKDGQNFGGGFGGFQGGFGGSGGEFSDFFDMFFGAQQGFGGDSGQGFGGRYYNQPQRGRDIDADLYLTLEEVTKGGVKEFTINIGGSPKNLKVNIPVGIKDNGRLRLSGQGRSGSPNGDLYLTVKYQKHPLFKVDEKDISVEVRIKAYEAVLGTKVRVPTLEGEVEMNIPAGCHSGRKFRLKGKGLGKATDRGDQYVMIAIDVPSLENMSEREKELWIELSEL